ncbi:hypothetical protein RI129_003146 [Pyrocoelia pectoralis]|uniref:Glucose-methanol-choline oxidoreductase N-terminal domain-containing protein n=1 Tax=Pyrocoelia pectoralis TaxID=417401 RepID=A0AAN7VQH4_9COLE
MSKGLICVLIFLYVFNCSGEDLLDYYRNLIKEETSRAYKLPWPKNAYQYIPKSKEYSKYGTYDHIIVGAGSAGSVIANRLTEDGFRNILLLEAGEDSNNFTDIPAMQIYLIGTEHNWGYRSVPQTTSCLGFKNKQCALHRGKGVGGTSLINSLSYIRGNKADYDNWRTQGNYGWSFKELLPYFKKSENFPNGDANYHGNKGYLHVQEWNTIGPQSEAFFEANKILGRIEVDYNGEKQLGYSKLQFNIKEGKRQDACTAFVVPAMHRSNLEILTNSYAIKILVDPNKKAYGILFARNGKIYVAQSRKDIILSAGTFGSPHLLMLSGIGPKKDLERFGIRVIQDLPVGNHLQDHPTFCYLEFLTNYTLPHRSLEDNIKQFLNGNGPLTNALNVDGVVFLQTTYAKVVGQPDVEIFMFPSGGDSEIMEKFWNIERNDKLNDTLSKNTITLMGVLLHPKSVGNVRLNSANPFEYPLIDPMLLSDEEDEDIERLYQSIEMIMELINTFPFKKLGTKLKNGPLPACKMHIYPSKQYWYCYLRQLTMPFFHPVGTCKMGPSPSNGAVVSPELKIFGVKNLRVADASVIPSSVSGHTNSIAMMIGEKVADLIKDSTVTL